ncbi:hypothetical protein PMG11_11002 [Penicillium brasilianum]|uniref:NACHT domain-containing protein n=1 Tax=Penicillium brasilianum TaxID=104259 RepID=A0A0F7U478_PENBI|nr:hypothetical protein PMG11_11002 [Penicillium brasilianum]
MTTQVDIRGNIAQAEAIQVNSVNLTTVHTLAEVDQLCLRTLRCANALVVKNKLKENKDKLLYDLIAWVFQDRQYLSWQDGEKISLLWIKGGAGRGKTMISIGLVDRLLRRQNDSTMVAYFFCQNANYELNTLESVIKGLIQQLVFKQQGLQIALRRRWDCLKNRFEEDTTSWRVLWDILLEMLEGCTCQRVYIIVDALDECRDDDKTDFLKLIVRTGLHNPAKIKWLLTSRPLHSADRELLTGNDQAQVSLELNLQHISEAVKTYVAFKVAELDRRHNYGKELRRKLEAVLNEKAESTYLWVSLVCKNLEGVHRDDALSTIQEMPPGLPSLYHRSCTQLRNRESVDAKNCIRLLKVMMLAYRPLHSSEVGSVTGITDSVLRIDALVDKCASLINMRGTIIDFVHQSARDYLSSGDGKALLDSHEDYGNGHVALSCLFFLSAELRFNICELPRLDSTGKLTEEMKDPKECALLASMEYAATFWAQHLEGDSNTLLVQNALTERGEVSRFLQAKFLEWLECLSLLDKQEMAIEVLKTMSRVAESAPFVSTFVQDATHFLVRHYHTIANWPLQIYSSATVFSPERSIVKRENLDKLPKWLKQIPRMDNDWSSVIHSMGGHSDKVKAVAFSPSGKRIASGSHDETIKIWDARTGDLEKTLAGHSDWVYAVAFSPDGKHIVSGSDDNTIKFWEIATGKLLKTLTGHSDCVSTVVFSPDGKHIASGSHDGTIKLWDTKTRNLSKTLAGHSGRVNSVAFSLDCKHIASGSADNTIKLWDTVSGALKKTLACHSDWVNAVAFSPDGKHIASGSGDNTIKIWDIATGNLWKIIDSHSDCVNTVAFSPDGKHIVSGSDDNTVRLWDAATTSLQKTLVGHSDWVNAVAFSPDGNHLVSGSNDNTIKLWDTMIRGLHKTQVGHSDYVTTLSLSPDARYVASGSHDSSVKLWDARSGALQKTFAGHLDALNAVDFSPDGMHIASASNDSTIRLWESVTGALEKTLAGHSDWVNAVAFSPDGKHIVSGSDDNTIKFWEVATGKLLKTLTGHSDCVSTVVFSPDGKQIASGSADNTIKIWDIATGNLWKTIDSHSDCVNTVAFSPDGKHIASGSGDDTVRLRQ